MSLVCAKCGKETDDTDACEACGEPPLLDGRYRLQETIGQGASGITYRAEAIEEGRTVCIKELTYRAMSSFEMQELFHREARVLRQLDHPGIPSYIDDFAVESGKNLSLYLVQEFVRGRTLREEMEATRYTEREVLEILLELTGILTYLQELRPPVFHRDIKPTNVMRTDNGDLVLVDFGSVKATTDGAAGGSTVAGTFGYMAPEQHWGEATRATDLYGLGVLGLVLLTREHPKEFVGDQHQLDWKGRLDATRPVVDLLDALLEQSADERPDNAEAAERLIRETLDAPAGDAHGSADASETSGDARSASSSDDEPPIPPPQTEGPAPPDPEVGEPGRAPSQTADADAQTIADARRSRTSPQSPESSSGRETGCLIAGGVFAVSALIAGFIVMGSIDSSSEKTEKVVVGPKSAPSDEPDPREEDHAPTINLEDFESCDPEDCAPIRDLLKTDLKFGLSVDEARDARPEVAAATKSSVGKLTASALPKDDAPRIEPPGPILDARMAVGERPASCSLDFFDDQKLSRIECVVSDFKTCSDVESFARESLRRLVARYGQPDASDSTSPPGFNGLNLEHRLADIQNVNWSWTWDGKKAELALRTNCTDLPGSNDPLSPTVRLAQTSDAHWKTLEELQRKEKRRRENQRKKRRRQKRKLEKKLRDLSEDDPL